jgi:hypothetical protein
LRQTAKVRKRVIIINHHVIVGNIVDIKFSTFFTLVQHFCEKVNHIYSNGSTGPRTGTEIKICGNVPFDRSGILGGYLSALGK